jgi:hypothetical protein
MSVKKQHYVPRVYLKSWETDVTNKKEPEKRFRGIYYYEKSNLDTGDGRNKDSVLWESRLYIVDYNLSFVMTICPKIKNDYLKQVAKKLEERQVAAYLFGQQLKTNRDLVENFNKLDDWEFKYLYYPFNIAKKSAILNDLKEINSYVIENALDEVMEKNWSECTRNFIDAVERTVPINRIGGIRKINEETALLMVQMIVYLICRNPRFDCHGILPQLKQTAIYYLPEAKTFEEQNERDDFIQDQMDALWIAEIYKGLYKVKRGYSYVLKQTAQRSFQMILFKCKENQGAFFTTDQPAFEHISSVEATNLNSIICPLSPQYLVMLMKGDENSIGCVDYRLVDNQLIKKLNSIILNHSENVIISNYKHLGYIL